MTDATPVPAARPAARPAAERAAAEGRASIERAAAERAVEDHATTELSVVPAATVVPPGVDSPTTELPSVARPVAGRSAAGSSPAAAPQRATAGPPAGDAATTELPAVEPGATPAAANTDTAAGTDTDRDTDTDTDTERDTDTDRDTDRDTGAEGGGADGDGGDAPAGAAPPPPRRSPLWARVLVVVGALLMLASGGALVGVKALADRYEGSVRKDKLLAPDARRQAPLANVAGPLNFLLLGSDARADDPTAGVRSDTIIIVHVNRSLDRAYLISVSRDMLVKIPAYPPANFAGGEEKVNGAFTYGGAPLVSATMRELTGVSFDGAAIVDFDGFKSAVRLLGGVYMCIDQRVESIHIGYDAKGEFVPPYFGDAEVRNPQSTPYVHEPGCRRLTEWEALDYVRQRKSLPDGDFGRQRHQQQFLRALVDEARRQSLHTDPVKLDRLVRAVGNSMTVDLNGMGLVDLVYALREVRPSQVTGIRIPAEPTRLGGIDYVVPIEAPAQSLYEAMRNDTLDSWVAANPTWVNPL